MLLLFPFFLILAIITRQWKKGLHKSGQYNWPKTKMFSIRNHTNRPKIMNLIKQLWKNMNLTQYNKRETFWLFGCTTSLISIYRLAIRSSISIEGRMHAFVVYISIKPYCAVTLTRIEIRRIRISEISTKLFIHIVTDQRSFSIYTFSLHTLTLLD